MTFAQLEALVAVVDNGGFTRAAARIGSSQPAVSHAVGSLERELGAKLLTRGHGRVGATEIGLHVVRLGREILAGADEIRQRARHANGSIVAMVQVAATPTVAGTILPSALELLVARHPDIDVTVLEGGSDEIQSWLEEPLVDVAFLQAAPELDELDRDVLGVDEHVALLPAGHRLVSQPVVTLEQLAAEAFVMANGGGESYVAHLFVSAGVPMRPAYSMTKTSTIATVVAQGLGVAIISGLAASAVDGDVAVRPLDPPAPRELGAYWPRRHRTAAARAVVGAVAATLAHHVDGAGETSVSRS